MSLPTFSDTPSLTREEALNQIISSIATEDLSLSHVLNAEGEKLQYALGTVPEAARLAEPPTVQDLLELNQSTRETIASTLHNQLLLKSKLDKALSVSIPHGPAGQAGTESSQSPP